jgi:hypothetical protein
MNSIQRGEWQAIKEGTSSPMAKTGRHYGKGPTVYWGRLADRRGKDLQSSTETDRQQRKRSVVRWGRLAGSRGRDLESGGRDQLSSGGGGRGQGSIYQKIHPPPEEGGNIS